MGVNNLKNVKKFTFQNLIYLNFIVKKKYRVDACAEKMGVHLDSLYRWIRGEKPFPIDRLSDLVNATEDTELLEYFTDPCGFTLLPKIKNKKMAETVIQIGRIMLSATDLKEDE